MFLHDLRYAARVLAQRPGWTAVVVLILALGIGANSTVFTLVNALFFVPPAAVEAPDELVRWNVYWKGVPSTWWSYYDYVFYRDHQDALVGVAAYDPDGMAVTASPAGGDALIPARAAYVSVNYFDVLGVRPAAGRTFRPEERDPPGAHPVAVLSHGFWRRAFVGRDDAVGSVLRLNGHTFTVVGVAAEGFQGLSPAEAAPDVWVPIPMQPVLSPSRRSWLERAEGWSVTWLQAVGRLRPDVPLAVAQARIDAISAALADAFPEDTNEGQGVELLPSYRFEPDTGSEILGWSWLLSGVVALVLLIAGSNVAVLLLARAAARRREIGVRLAIGASRGQVVRQLLAESLLLALWGGAAGYLLAFVSARILGRLLPIELVASFTPDLRVLAFTFAVAVLTALVFGLAPALGAARTNLVEVLKSGDQSAGRGWLRHALVVVQVGLSIVLVTGAALFVKSLAAAEAVELGYAVEDRLVVTTSLRQHGYEGEAASRFIEDALERLAALPGAREVSVAALVPFHGRWNSSFTADGAGLAPDEKLRSSFNAVGPDYFETMDVPLVDGRGFDLGDRPGSAPVAVLSEAAAEMIWPGERAVGRSLKFGDGDPTVVVGVAKDTRVHELAGDPEPYVYRPILQQGLFEVNFIVHTAGEPLALARAVRDEIHRLDKNIAFSRVRTMEDVVERLLGPFRLGARLLTLFGVLALVLAAAGLFGVLTYLVVRETRAIGIRMALGSSPRRVAVAVVQRGLALTVLGIVGGGLVALWAAGLVGRFLFAVEPRDPQSFVAVAVILVVVALAASLVPAWRAARVEPMEALREE